MTRVTSTVDDISAKMLAGVTAMGFYEDRVLPHIINVVMNNKQTRETRARVCSGLSGEVVEIGFGTGHNLPFVPSEVTRLRAVEPSGRSVELAGNRIAAAPFPVEVVGLDGQQLALEDDCADHVLCTWSMCTIPDAVSAVREMRRVLRPGGLVLFAGEPSARGDRLAAIPKRAGLHAAPLWRRLMRARPAAPHEGAPGEGEALEPFVDVHAFVPEDLRDAAAAGGLTDVRVQGEELVANWFGWFNRTVEATAEYDDVPWMWRQYAFRGYLALQTVDRVLLEPRLPAGIFYNLMLTARRP